MKLLNAARAEPFYPQDDQPLIAFRLSQEEMVERFGPAHRNADAADDEPGPCEYRSFRFPCGLAVFIAWHSRLPGGPGGDVCASSPDIEHILHHIPVGDRVFWRLDQVQPDFFLERYGLQAGKCGNNPRAS